jgi:hypothetical protein
MGELMHTDNLQQTFVIAGRSAYYGAVLYAGDQFDHLWPSILLQAAAVVLALGLTLANAGRFDWFILAAIVAGLALASPMAFFVSFLMPDIFAGLVILAAGNLLSYGDQMTRTRLAIWVIVLCTAVLFHTSHLLLVLTILAFAAVSAMLTSVPLSRKGIACLAFGVAVGFASQEAFALGVTKMLGAAPVTPPFIMTRLIVDGPGAAYVKAQCPEAHFAACGLVGRLPTPMSFISSDERRHAGDNAMINLFNAVAPETRRALSEQQFSFALATIRYDPVGVIESALGNVIIQLRSFRLSEFDYQSPPSPQLFFTYHIPQQYLSIMEMTKAWTGQLPLGALWLVITSVTVLSGAYIVGFLLLTRRRKLGPDAFVGFVGVILIGIVLNAAVCGVLSGPFDRFQARVVWLVPLTAALAFYRRRAGREFQPK